MDEEQQKKLGLRGQGHDKTEENEDNEEKRIQISIEDLSSCVLDYYSRLSNDKIPELSEEIPNQFIKIQKEVINVVQMRKNMEKIIEKNIIFSEHFETVSSLVEENMKLQERIDEMAGIISNLTNKNMEIYVKCLLQIQNKQILKESEIIKKGEAILMEMSDIKRSFHFQNHTTNIDNKQNSLQKIDNYSDQNLNQLIKEERQKEKTLKLIYNCKFKELQLRNELIQQQQKIFFDYQRSNSELIESLLREKEKDKNLRKKENQKYIELLKNKYCIDLQEQNLNYSQKHLEEDLFIALNKKKLKLKENRSQIDALINSKQLLIQQNLAFQQKIKNITLKYDQKMSECLQLQEEKINDYEKRMKEYQRQLQNIDRQKETKIKELSLQNNEMGLKVQSLTVNLQKCQGYMNKYEQKIELLTCQIQNLKGKHSKQIDDMKQEYSNQILIFKLRQKELQNELVVFKKDNTRHLQGNKVQIDEKISQITMLKLLIDRYEQRIDILLATLQKTEHQKVTFYLQKKQLLNTIEQLKRKEQQDKAIQQQERQQVNSDTFSSDYQQLREELLQQIQKNKMIKFDLIDSFMAKIDHIII